MKTIKLRITNHPELHDDMRVYSAMVRIAFNRFQDGLDETTISKKLRTLFGVNCWLALSATKEAHGIFDRFGQKKIIFGGKFNLVQRLKGKITKERFREKRLHAICSLGETRQKGNRLIDFDLPGGRLFYKPKKGTSVEIAFCKPKKRLAKELVALQCLIELKRLPISVWLSSTEIRLTYDETLIHQEAYKGLKNSRILGIDMNPNYIGVSVIEFDSKNEFRVLHKEVFDLSQLTARSGEASSSKGSKYLTNKLKRETIAIAHKISGLTDCWKCSKLAVEGLKFKAALGRGVPRGLCCNKWQRALFANKLKMLAGIHKFEIVEVNPAYSSIVGNFAYGSLTTPDMIAASIEIARRAHKKFEKGWFYPKFNYDSLDERWKQTLGRVKTWKDLFLKIKELKCRYRFQLPDCIRNAVSRTYKKQRWKRYVFE